MKTILSLGLLLIPLGMRAVSLTGAQTAPSQWTYTLTFAPLDNYSIFQPNTTITLTNLFGVTNAAGPTSTDFPSPYIDQVNTNWTAEVLHGGTEVRWTHVGGGTGNFSTEQNVFGFRVFANGAADGLVSLATSGFSRDKNNPLPDGLFNLDITGLVAGPVHAANAPPTVTCPPATVVECGTEALLTAEVSDPEGDAMVVVWTLDGTAIQTNLVLASSAGTATNVSISGWFPLGTNILAIRVTDGTDVASCTTSVTVVDTTPPMLSSVVASPNVLWPPDHKMVRVNLRASVNDSCGSATWEVIAIRSNEPLNSPGDGNTSIDWNIIADDTIELRAEHAGHGGGRVYYITVQATDASNNQSEMQTVTVTVPKSPGKGK
jgi:hypothetical protein